ncbi:MAG: helix-turn-helix domain-containing protein [Hyphomicrobiaceae bacterium]|nr:helix-turn-helix domain-containing protein [Hyphomicrobiaceae bacterium]
MAAAGLFHKRRVAVLWTHISSFEERFPHGEAHSSLYELDRDRLSCAGETVAINAVISFIAALEEGHVTNAVCSVLLKDRIRHATDGQGPRRYQVSRNAALREALEIIESEIEVAPDVEQVARRVGRSRRQFERLFHRPLGRSPVAYYRNLRLDKTRDLLLNTAMPVIAVAAACNFGSQQGLTRAKKARFGHTPYEERGIVRLRISPGKHSNGVGIC